eukprot:8117-Heterococcus_DN1.PRE.3
MQQLQQLLPSKTLLSEYGDVSNESNRLPAIFCDATIVAFACSQTLSYQSYPITAHKTLSWNYVTKSLSHVTPVEVLFIELWQFHSALRVCTVTDSLLRIANSLSNGTHFHKLTTVLLFIVALGSCFDVRRLHTKDMCSMLQTAYAICITPAVIYTSIPLQEKSVVNSTTWCNKLT